ncbi:hypothetical protein [Nitrosomonas sp. Nm34]|nr:hypothetical protein [Nitrosomonas sp. Nm34]
MSQERPEQLNLIRTSVSSVYKRFVLILLHFGLPEAWLKTVSQTLGEYYE